MSLGNEIGKILYAVAEESDGFKFGKPWRNTDRSLGLVIPILREKDHARKYIMFEETKKGEIDIEDTGNVNIMKIVSKSGDNVFIRSGVILSGDGQTRTVVSGMCVVPNSEQDLKVKCVYASKPTHRGAKMDYDDIAPPIVMQSLYKSQRDTWDSVHSYTSRMKGTNSSFSSCGGPIGARYAGHVSAQSINSDDLLGVMKHVENSQKSIEGAIKDIPVQKNQVGAIIFDIDSIVGFEFFDSPESWKSLHKKVISKYNEVLQKEQDKMLFELKPEVIPEKISDFIEDVSKSDEKTAYTNNISNTVMIDGDMHTGEYTTIGSEVIHVIIFKRDKPRRTGNGHKRDTTSKNTSPRIISSIDKN